jgi:GDPmannose 4,6-dehydratase
MLQHDMPEDFVIATGESYTVREFVRRTFQRLDLDWTDHVRFDPRYVRPSEVDALRGDASKARLLLEWEPTIDFDTLIDRMVQSDLELANRELVLRNAGHELSPDALAIA